MGGRVTDKPDPMAVAPMGPGVRPPERSRLGDGATRDPGAIAAYVLATEHRRRESDRAAVLVTTAPRGYTRSEHERAEILRGEAQALRRIAAAKLVPAQRRLVEREADALDRSAEEIVPLAHARAGWR